MPHNKSIHFLLEALLAGLAIMAYSCSKPDNGYIDPSPDPPPTPEPVILPSLVLTDQNYDNATGHDRIVIIDPSEGKEIWSWTPEDSGLSQYKRKFHLPDECKPVYRKTCILMTASGGGVALIRISDKKALFYAFPGDMKNNAGKNPHSAEVLPDGNIAVACSDGGNIHFYKYSKTEPYVKEPSATLAVKDAHSVVWDKEGDCLWYAEGNTLRNCTYSCTSGVISVNERGRFANNALAADVHPHDLAPVIGSRRFFISYPSALYSYDIGSGTFAEASGRDYITVRIKSISFAPDEVPAIAQVAASATNWTSGKTFCLDGRTLGIYDNYLIYKSRWFVENTFSYGENGQELEK